MLLCAQALNSDDQGYPPVSADDFASFGAGFSGIEADFAQTHPRPLYGRAGQPGFALFSDGQEAGIEVAEASIRDRASGRV